MRLLSLYEMFPFENHPLWLAITKGDLTLDEVIRAELQHYVRTKAGQPLRFEAVRQAEGMSKRIFELLLQTYIEECTTQDGTATHLQLVERLLLDGGLRVADLESARPTIANSLAIAMYRDISRRGAACHMLGAGAVEHYYALLSPSIFRAYTEIYHMTQHQAATYAIHGVMDREHAQRAFDILPEAIELHGWELVEASVRDAFAATSLHYDGMLEGATGITRFWNGGRA